MARSPSTPPARQPLTRERVLEAAVALADHEGIEGLTMRRLADALGAGAMSLYYHVPGKDELIDGMVELVFAEIEPPSRDVDWRTAMRSRAHSTRTALRRHPWAVGLMESRVRPGPANVRLHDAVLGCLREAGFSIELAIHAYSVQDAYIYGFALQEKSLPFDSAEEIPGVVEQQERHAAQDLAIGALTDEYPYIAEVVLGHITTSGYDFGDEFAYGLDLILDALEERRKAAS